MLDVKTAPIDWAAYRFRDGFTLFEVACLLHRLDPRAVSDDAHQAIRRRGGTAAEVLKNPAATAEMLHLNPAAYFMRPVGDTLERLKRAAGARLGLSVNAARAREMATMLGLPYPPELEREATACRDCTGAQDQAPRRTAGRRAGAKPIGTQLDATDWQSTWAALVKLAEPAPADRRRCEGTSKATACSFVPTTPSNRGLEARKRSESVSSAELDPDRQRMQRTAG